MGSVFWYLPVGLEHKFKSPEEEFSGALSEIFTKFH